MDLPPLKILLNQLEWNLEWLQHMENNEPTDYFRDAALQRFEFTFQTALKCILSAAGQQETDGESPEDCFSLAERRRWLPEAMPWKEMVQDYTGMKEGADPAEAHVVFARLTQYRDGLQILFDRLSSHPPES